MLSSPIEVSFAILDNLSQKDIFKLKSLCIEFNKIIDKYDNYYKKTIQRKLETDFYFRNTLGYKGIIYSYKNDIYTEYRLYDNPTFIGIGYDTDKCILYIYYEGEDCYYYDIEFMHKNTKTWANAKEVILKYKLIGLYHLCDIIP